MILNHPRVNPNAVDAFGGNIVNFSILVGRADILLLLHHNSRIDFWALNREGQSPIQFASLYCKPLVKLIGLLGGQEKETAGNGKEIFGDSLLDSWNWLPLL